MSSAKFETLRQKVRGTVIEPGDDEYQLARRVYNGMHDCHPAVVVRCVDAADVMAALAAAREGGLEVAVRGGSHSVPGFGTCDDGLVVDLSPMRWVRVDPESRTARVGGGATWGALDHATHAFGLATTGGVISTTGVAGLTLGGGIGYLARRFGLSCDNLLSADLVTADGRFVTASEYTNPDLFWALRGGGGNFGVVTSLEFQLHPVDQIVGGPIFYDIERAGEVLQFFQQYVREAPEELGAFFGFHKAPPLPFLPPERHGDNMCAVVTCWTGPAGEAERVLKPLRQVAPAVGEHVGQMPYPMLNAAFDPLLPPGLRHYWKAVFEGELSAEAIATHLKHGAEVPTIQSLTHLYPINGAVHRVGDDETAFPRRDTLFATVIAGVWEDASDDSAIIRWVRDYYADLQPLAAAAGYVNFMAGDDAGRVEVNYGRNYKRLAGIKRAWDPDNLFARNQNIKPAAVAA
jgi:FAD/FMN-containing dehydrogenase